MTIHKNAQVQQEDFIQKNERLEWELKEARESVANMALELANALELIAEIPQVVDWYICTCNAYEETEHYQNHPDQDSYHYLKDQAAGVKSRALAAQLTPAPADTE